MLYTNSDNAGAVIVAVSVTLVRPTLGINNPLSIEVTSSIDEPDGLVVPIPT